MQDLTGKTAVVTGGASGIGRAMVDAFLAEDMQIVIGDVEADALTAVTDELTAGGHAVLGVRTDVSDYSDVEALRDAAVERFGAIHVVCNNAGVGGSMGRSWELTLDDWRWTINVNLWGVINGIKAFVPTLIAQGEPAHIVNTASLAGHFANAGMAPYTASKYGVVAMSECLFHELAIDAPTVKVSVLCPQFIATNISDSDRNRPADLSDTGDSTAEQEMIRDVIASMIAAGDPPSAMADAVVEAIHDDKFWIIPAREIVPAIEARYRTIRDEKDPFNPMAAFTRD
jgi:NAD(P)-dependent dehydrogenase (short-subunit alcohol dehydrogenase family)